MTQAHSQTKRYRGFVLTNEGLQKLNNCIQKLEAQTRMRYGASAIARKVQLVESDGIHPITVRKILQCQTGVDYRSIDHVFQALQLSLSEGDYAHADLCKPSKSNKSKWTNISSSSPNYINIPDISNFYGRTQEIAQLESKIICESIKVVALSGTLGIGKTATAIKLVHSLKSRFDFVIWKSLRQAPTLQELLISLLNHFPTVNKNHLPTSLCSLIDLFLENLQHHHCLLIFDGFETVMNKQDAQDTTYNDFLQILLDSKHQSNVILTTRKTPNLIGILEDKNLYSIRLNSLQIDDIKQIFSRRGIYKGSLEHWIHLVHYYGGNPLALKTVSNQIFQYFECNIPSYLRELTASNFILQDFQKFLIGEIQNLSRLEKKVIQKLAFYTNQVSLSQLRQDLNEPKIEPYLLNVLDDLNSRALIEQHGACFALQPFIGECIFHLNML